MLLSPIVVFNTIKECKEKKLNCLVKKNIFE